MINIDTILPFHLLTLGFALWNVIIADHAALQWIRGKKPTLDEQKMNKLHRNVWIGLCLMILTGFLMFWQIKDFLLTRPQFYAKMAFVLALVLNAFFVGKSITVARTREYKNLTTREKITIFISGAISTIGWLGAIAGGFYLLPD